MIPLLFVGAALAAAPLHVEATALMGMRAGAGGLVTVEPVRHLEVGGTATVTTDLYGFAPTWVTDGLDPKHNLRISLQPAIGVNTGDTRVSFAMLGSVGLEMLTFRESRDVPPLDKPVVYGTTELVPVGGVTLDLRVRPTKTWGMNMMIYTPLPPTPTGNPNLERLHAGLGVVIPLGPKS